MKRRLALVIAMMAAAVALFGCGGGSSDTGSGGSQSSGTPQKGGETFGTGESPQRNSELFADSNRLLRLRTAAAAGGFQGQQSLSEAS